MQARSEGEVILGRYVRYFCQLRPSDGVRLKSETAKVSATED